MRTLILGCGPAGLIAAHAAAQAGSDVAILSKNRKSFMKGAQYLHRPIPHGISTDHPFEVSYVLKGSPQQYRMKVYGPKWDGNVSPEDLAESHMGWDIRHAYDRLWNQYREAITDWEATPSGLKAILTRDRADLVVSSIPAPLLCAEGHTFGGQRIWSGDQPMGALAENTVVCNGEESPSWYRAARIKGWDTVEWPEWSKPPITPLWEVVKPKTNNCTCFPDVLRVGRYGRWEKGVLSHEAYNAVVEAIAGRDVEMF